MFFFMLNVMYVFVYLFIVYVYLQMYIEYYIDFFDFEFFFKFYDFDMNGYWDEFEIQVVYGLYYYFFKDKMCKGVQVDVRVQNIVSKVFEVLDKN